jgi:hypothetical protein
VLLLALGGWNGQIGSHAIIIKIYAFFCFVSIAIKFGKDMGIFASASAVFKWLEIPKKLGKTNKT